VDGKWPCCDHCRHAVHARRDGHFHACKWCQQSDSEDSTEGLLAKIRGLADVLETEAAQAAEHAALYAKWIRHHVAAIEERLGDER
jgi:hypothetical protein